MDEKRARPQTSAHPPDAPELPTEKAFVLQLSRESGPALEPFAGRVEHLASGRRLRFDGLVDFQAALIRLLTEAQERSVERR
jgi:hypothetical protein